MKGIETLRECSLTSCRNKVKFLRSSSGFQEPKMGQRYVVTHKPNHNKTFQKKPVLPASVQLSVRGR